MTHSIDSDNSNSTLLNGASVQATYRLFRLDYVLARHNVDQKVVAVRLRNRECHVIFLSIIISFYAGKYRVNITCNVFLRFSSVFSHARSVSSRKNNSQAFENKSSTSALIIC